jgi:8-oxo-dGTP pyrophosphatase MutT (NUDIX family)/transcriptional regulator with XRE-family HTH domain
VALPSEVFRVRLREVRRLKGWTQQQLADALVAAGVKLDASAVTRLERGTRGLSLDDVIAIAAVLGVSPLHMVVPLNGATSLDVTPEIAAEPAAVRAWMRGQLPLRDTDDERLFYTQTPENDFDTIAPATLGRFESRADFEAARAAWERELLRALAAGGIVSMSHPLPTITGEPVPEPPSDKPQRPAVITAIVTSAKGVLVGKRNDGKPPWTFIAGENEPLESPADTIVREVKEETGLEIVAGEILGERVHPKTGRHMVYVAARPARRSLKVIVGDTDELAEVRWVSLAEADELLPGMFGPVRDYLERTLAGGAQEQ